MQPLAKWSDVSCIRDMQKGDSGAKGYIIYDFDGDASGGNACADGVQFRAVFYAVITLGSEFWYQLY